MMEVSIATARGIALAATLGVPDTADPLDLPALGAALEDGRKAPDRSEGLVILAHNFLTDRHGLAHRLDDMAARGGVANPLLPKLAAEHDRASEFMQGLARPQSPRDHARDTPR